jgi:hypothetical protein
MSRPMVHTGRLCSLYPTVGRIRPMPVSRVAVRSCCIDVGPSSDSGFTVRSLLRTGVPATLRVVK